MRISFVTYSLSNGGAERVIANLANYFIAEGMKVDVITLLNTDISYKLNPNINVIPLDNIYTKENNVEVKKNKLEKIPYYLKKMVLNHNRKNILKDVIQRLNSDVFVSFLPEPSFMLLKLRKYVPGKIVVSVRNDPKIEYSNLRRKILMKRLYKMADGFVFQTSEAMNYFSQEIKSKAEIIANSLNPNFIKKRYEGKRKKEIVTVGRLVDQKNQKLLIESFKDIVSDIDEDYKLIIYGDGYLKDNLANYINQCGLSDRVILGGKIDCVEDVIYKSNIFVLSSDYEGMPNALIEAMSLGLSVISTDCPCGGPRELIKDGDNGLLVEVGNREMLSKKMLVLINDDNLRERIGVKAQEIQKKLNPEIINKKWLDYLMKIKKGQ